MTTLNHITDKKSLKIKKVKYLQSEIEDMIHMIQKKWDGWVFLDRDKNIGSFAIACPMWYRHQLIKTFDWTAWKVNYLRVQKKEEDILMYWKNNLKRETYGTKEELSHTVMDFQKKKI